MKIDCNRTSRSIFQYIVNPTKSSTTQRSTSAPLSTGFNFHQIPNAETVKNYLQERKGWKDLKVVQNQGNIHLFLLNLAREPYNKSIIFVLSCFSKEKFSTQT